LALHVPQLPENKSFLLLFWKKRSSSSAQKEARTARFGPFLLRRTPKRLSGAAKKCQHHPVRPAAAPKSCGLAVRQKLDDGVPPMT
jgi:hypothetical protein